MNKNFWGEPDDIEPLPDWMLADTHKNPVNKKFSNTKTVEDAARACLKKPSIDVTNYSIENDMDKTE
jgi:hypothetical protein